MARSGKDGKPWWRKDRRCYYAWIHGNLTRLDPDKERAFALWHQLCSTRPDDSGPQINLVETMKRYLEYLPAHYKPNTVLSRTPSLKRFASEYKGVISAVGIRDYIDQRKRLKPGGKFTLAGVLRAFLKWCEEEGVCANVD